jgi:hypothetical protein
MTNLAVSLNLEDPMTAAASLMATAALSRTASAINVSVTVSGTHISVQVPRHSADEAARVAAVAEYARILAVPVCCRVDRDRTWIEAYGYVGRHSVHVWTVAGADEPHYRKEAYPTA